VITLPVGRKRSVALVESLHSGDIIGVVTQKDPKVTDPAGSDLHTTGTFVRVLETVRLPNGEYRLSLESLDRLTLTSVHAGGPYWRGEGIVKLRIGRRLRPLVRRQRQNVVCEHVATFNYGGGLHEEEVVEVLVEDLRSAAGRLDEGISVALGHARRGDRQQARERSENDVDFVLGDEVLVVGHDLVRARGVVDDLDLHLPPEDAAGLVDLWPIARSQASPPCPGRRSLR